MSHLPLSVILLFLVTAVVAFVLFALAVRGSSRAIFLCLLWIGAQCAVALSGFYLGTKTLPPDLFLAIAPPLILIAALFLTVGGRRFIDRMSLKWSVLIHSIRTLVEINLYILFCTSRPGADDLRSGQSRRPCRRECASHLVGLQQRKPRPKGITDLEYACSGERSECVRPSHAFRAVSLSALRIRSANHRNPGLSLRAASSISGSGGPALSLCCDP